METSLMTSRVYVNLPAGNMDNMVLWLNGYDG